jgi:hypothetical protein
MLLILAIHYLYFLFELIRVLIAPEDSFYSKVSAQLEFFII